MMAERFTLFGTAVPGDATKMLDELCARFVEHPDVHRIGNAVTLANQAAIRTSAPSAAGLRSRCR
jgi:hypothetical protein